jgi:hypothetical protein
MATAAPSRAHRRRTEKRTRPGTDRDAGPAVPLHDSLAPRVVPAEDSGCGSESSWDMTDVRPEGARWGTVVNA